MGEWIEEPALHRLYALGRREDGQAVREPRRARLGLHRHVHTFRQLFQYDGIPWEAVLEPVNSNTEDILEKLGWFLKKKETYIIEITFK